MAKQRITANGELDLLTSDELARTLKSWSVELTRGAKLRRVSILGTATAGGDLLMGDNNDGPHEGMVWAITRLSVAPGPTLGAGGLQVYANDVNGSGLLIRNLVTDVFPGDHGCNIGMGDSIRIAGAGITANAPVCVTLSIKEVPELMVWSL
jgi:hypothetical protein